MDAESVVMGYIIGYNDGLDSGGGAPSDDWQPPDWWIPVPEPEPYEIYILIQVENAGKGFDFKLFDEQGYVGMGTIHCDWGDGTEEDYKTSSPSHTYTETGQFLIHITGDKNAFFLNDWRFNDNNNGSRDIVGLIIKTGANIAFRTDYYDEHYYNYTALFVNKSFKYIKIMHPKGLPTEQNISYFQGCHNLQKLELAKKISGELPQYIFNQCYALKDIDRFIDCDSITKIGNYAFSYCYGLQKIGFPNCTEINSSSFVQCYNLIRANLPSCAAIGDYGFSQCYNLQEIITAEDCAYGNGCFRFCYSLYPRPDGSTN